MKKLIALILILIITPFLITSDETLNQQAEDIRVRNSKNPETLKWEYVKDRAFDNNGEVQKGYNKPVVIQLGIGATSKDSITVNEYIKKIKELVPSIEISSKLYDASKLPFHYVNLSFGSIDKNFQLLRHFTEFKLPDSTTIFRSRPGFIVMSDSSKTSIIDFNFKKDISDLSRKLYIESELSKAVFIINSTQIPLPYNKLFNIQTFNDTSYDESFGFLGNEDKYLLQKLYSDNFKEQLGDYLYAHYPWPYAFSFLNKEKMKMFAMSIVTMIGILVFTLLFSYFQNRKFKYSLINYFFPVLLILLHFINLNYIYKYLTDYNSFIGWEENIMFMLIIVPPTALLISAILWLFDRVINNNSNFTLQLVLKVVITFFAFNIPIGLLFLINGEFYAHDHKFQEFYFPLLFFWIALALGRGLLIYLNHISKSLVKEKDVELSKLKELYSKAELKSLQSQINPHFLYNSLNSIASLAPIDTEKTQKMAYSLSNLFKYSINRKDKKMNTIGDEINMVENYLEIEKIRFGERLQFSVEVDKSLENVKIPMFLIQPLIENAIKHGLSKIEGQGIIFLKIEKGTSEIVISITDNGPHFPEGLVSGHGLQTVYDLLRLSYGDKANLNWQNLPQKTISITIPKIA